MTTNTPTNASDDSDPIEDGPPCPWCGAHAWERTPDDDSELICTECHYASDEI